MKLRSGLEQLLELHQQYHALAQVTVGLLEQSDFEALEDAWTKRRELFKKLSSQRAKLEVFFNAWDSHMAVLPQSESEFCRALVAEIEQTGGNILELDKKAENLLGEAKAETKKQLDHLQTGSKALKAYQSSGRLQKPNLFISKSG